MKRILVTGANGFVGRHLCAALVRRRIAVRALVRDTATALLPADAELCASPDLGPDTVWDQRLFDGVDAVAHLAARVHVMRERAADPAAAFRRVNVQGTERLARAVAGRVRRLVFVSSVHAVRTLSDEILGERSACRPDTPYGRSKLAAEQSLAAIGDQTGLEIVVVRPAPVYGPGGAGNLLALLKWARRGWPLPLASLTNRRSVLFVGNLVDALIACCESPPAAGRTFMVSDAETVSTADLIRRAATAGGRSVRLWPAPLWLLRGAGRCCGKQSAVERLVGSLEIDSSQIRRTLAWVPPFTLDDGLRQTVASLGTHT